MANITEDSFRFAYSTAKKSSVSTAYRCCIIKSSPWLDSSCQDSHISDVSGAWAVLQKTALKLNVTALNVTSVTALNLEIWSIATVPPH